ncbi:glutamyl aminopeptidase [Vagococcus elongatus]|uniref:Glutamyl aminopeptidase n=1 Tax=Vagococcus elongatus TaxID=180344 RepID=A0A430AM05_9ENTE|nr:glutamyl aminopeptidase [Vagococcus elongatus]RSU09180.1 glutamyl aminopeptidase [Vagococcus elongatus]
MDEKSFLLIKELTQVQGASGSEEDVRQLMAAKLAPLVDRVEYDGLGGVFGIKESKNPDAPRVMVAAHMDEVGFMLTQIMKNGMMRVQPLGGWNPYVVSAQRFTLKTRQGDYPIISSSIPPHLLRGSSAGQGKVEVSDILFDAGFESEEEAKSFGVRPGDSIVPDVETIKTANGKNIICKAWDNRYGCVAVLEMFEALKDVELPFTLIGGANVQEEVGLRGARPSAHKFKPDIFFAVDCSPANDLDGKQENFGKLGEGFLVRIFDPGMIMLKSMHEFVIDVAEKNHIPHQYFVSKGGTDAGAAHLVNDGIPSAVIGVPGRYIHTHQTMFRMSDYEAARQMLIASMKTLTPELINTIIYGK